MLYNFNSYEGMNEFDFTSNDSSKNIILIGGKNGAGKTSLFTAIKIALYLLQHHHLQRKQKNMQKSNNRKA